MKKGRCLRCGKCCNGMAMTFMVTDNNLATREQTIKWILDHDNIEVIEIKEIPKIVIVHLLSPCRQLYYVKGKACCGIYENRPQECRDFPIVASALCHGFEFEQKLTFTIRKRK